MALSSCGVSAFGVRSPISYQRHFGAFTRMVRDGGTSVIVRQLWNGWTVFGICTELGIDDANVSVYKGITTRTRDQLLQSCHGCCLKPQHTGQHQYLLRDLTC